MLILHTADWHQRTSQYSRHSRGTDFLNAALNIIEIARQRRVDVIVNSGDILNRAHIRSAEFAMLRQIHEALCDAGIPMLTVMGNHDLDEPGWLTQLDRRHGMSAGLIPIDGWTQPTPFEQPRGTEVIHVTVLPQGGSATVRPVLESLPFSDIVVYHGIVREFVGFPTEGTVTLDDFATAQFRLGLLGDIHRHDYRETEDRMRCIGYPGSIELCSKDEPAQKYVRIFDLKPGQPITHEDVEVPTRRTLFLRIRSEEDLTDSVEQMRAVAHENPMVFLNYDPRVPEVLPRLTACLDMTQAILRPRQEKPEHEKAIAAMAASSATELRPLHSFIAEMAPDESGFPHRLARGLLDRPDRDTFLTQMIEARRLELQSV